MYFSSFRKPLNEANPTGTGGQSPAERAAALGLQSDGKGGYLDSSGQVVARTVNNELVFYDQGPTGGAVSDGEGGQAQVQAQPSWADDTGMILVPPGRPEGPEEIAAVPDPIPATAPAGYDAFMKKKRLTQYQQPEQQQDMGPTGYQNPETEVQPEVMQPSTTPVQAVGENFEPGSLVKKLKKDQAPEQQQPAPNLAQRAAAAGKTFSQVRQPQPPETRAQEREMERPRPDDKMIKKQAKGILGDLNQERLGDKIDTEAEEGRRQKLTDALDRMMADGTGGKGAGKNNLSREDIEAFKNYIENGPQNEKTPVTEDELEYAMQYLKNTSGDKWTAFEGRLKGKGDPPAARKIKERAREVVQSYLENLGTSAIDGDALPFSDSELDHGISLDNGGEDNGENWRWLPTRFNQFKGALEDADLLKKLNAELERDPTDDNLKKRQQDLLNKIRGDLSHQFKDGGIGGLNVADIMSQKGTEGMQFLKALAEANGISHYKDRGMTRDSGRAGGGTSLAIGELQQRLIDELNIPTGNDIDMFDENMFQILDDIEEERHQLGAAKKLRSKEKRDAKKAAKQAAKNEQTYYSYDELVMTIMEALQ